MANNTLPTTKPPDPVAEIFQATERAQQRIRSLEAQVMALTAERDARDRQIGRLQAMLLRGDEFVKVWREMREGFTPLVMARGAQGPAPLPRIEVEKDPEPEPRPPERRGKASPFKGRPRIVYSEEDVAGWAALWDQGKSLEEISDECGAGVATVRRRLSLAGVDVDAPRGAEADPDGDEDEDDEGDGADEDAA